MKRYIRYPNRRVYDTVQKKYVQLWDVAENRIFGDRCVDHETKQDVTDFVVASAAHEEEAKRLNRWKKKLGLT